MEYPCSNKINLILYTKINLRWIIYLNAKFQTIDVKPKSTEIYNRPSMIHHSNKISNHKFLEENMFFVTLGS